MSKKGIYPRTLLVEGGEDQYAIAGLMSAYVKWGDNREEWPVLIKAIGSVGELLKDGVISSFVKQPEAVSVGILLDANDSMPGRWQRIRQLTLPLYPSLPEDLPSDGLVHEHEGMPRLGVWIMPDNANRGMLETFLAFLVPTASADLWAFAKKATAEAAAKGATYKPVHLSKALISAWLAWQDPPGMPLGEALIQECLKPKLPPAQPFADWFVRLFGLESIRI